MTLVVFLMPCDVSVLWLFPIVLRVGIHCDINVKRELACCLTLIVFLMPCDVSVLWLVHMVLRVGLQCEIDGTREPVA